MAPNGRAPVVAGVDGSDCALEAVRWAAGAAALRGTALRLVASYPVPASSMVSDPAVRTGFTEAVRATALDQLETAAAAAREAAPDVAVEQVAEAGLPAHVLQHESTCADVVVLGSRGLGGFTGLLIGSVAVALAAHSACPVVVVREPVRALPVPEVVVGVDDSPASEAAVGFAFAEAALRDARLVAVRTWQRLVPQGQPAPMLAWDAVEKDERASLAACLEPWQQEFPQVPVRHLVLCDRAARALVEASGRAQLIVVGSRGRGGLKGMLLGSVSQVLLRHARCPVAVVRSGEPPAA